MKCLILIVALFIGSAFAQSSERPSIIREQQGNVTNLRIEGNLEPTRDVACIALSEAKSAYTPPDIHTAIVKCISRGDFAKAASLFMLAGIYSRFDAERVADKTARGGVRVLIMNTFGRFSKEQKEGFSGAANQLTQASSELQAFCSELVRIGPPTYFPKYLILHGMNAFTSPNPLENAIDLSFDAVSTWARLQETYAHCPK